MDILNSLATPREEACPSDFVLSEFEAEVLDAEAKAEVSAHVADCARCQSWLKEGRAAFEAVPEGERSQMVDRIHAAQPERRFGFRAPAGVGVVLAAAAALVFFVLPPPPPDDPLANDTHTAKGGLSMKVYVEREGKVDKAMTGQPFFENDRLRFEVDVPEDGHVMVFGVEADGDRYPCVPNQGGRSLPVKRGSHLLEDAIELDDSVGKEQLNVVYCPHPFDFASLPSGRRTPESKCIMRTFELDKR